MTNLAPKIALGSDFLTAYSRIPRQKQRSVMNFVTRFRANPRSPGINYEVIRNTRDKNLRSVRIDQDYRGIVLSPEQGNVYVLLWVDKHDDAYDWAARHRCEINPRTGALQLYESETLPDDQQPDTATEPYYQAPVAEPDLQPEAPLLFNLDADTLLSLGIPSEHLKAVQLLTSEEQLETLERKLPVEAFEALYLLAAGTSLEEVLQDYGPQSNETIDTEDYASALERSHSQRQFCVPEDEQELGRMLNAPLDKWRVFLHPTQRNLVERNWNGPVRVLGGAGTGKTVVAMHRARWLVSRLDWPKNANLLFTTFTSNLALDIREQLKAICTPEQLQRIEVINLDAWVNQFVRRNGFQSRIVYPGNPIYQQCWKLALGLCPSGLDVHPMFYAEEWQRVILPQQVRTRQDYFKATRIGRGVALNRRQRADIWPVFEEMRAQLARRDAITAEDAIHQAIDILKQGQDSRQYHSIVVDEGQDFTAQAYSLLRQLAPEQSNDIFIVGDAHQRIYQRTTSLRASGINIMGRGRKLKINYRTTELIRRYATALLENQPIDDLDEGSDSSHDYRSLVQGEAPVIKKFGSAQEESDWLAQEIRDLIKQEKISASDICVVARTNRLCEQYEQALQSNGLETWRLSRERDNRQHPGVRLATMHRIKGLEFRAVFIVAVNDQVVPLQHSGKTDDPVEQRLGELTERALFHVAATRAMRHLYVSSSGTPSPFLT